MSANVEVLGFSAERETPLADALLVLIAQFGKKANYADLTVGLPIHDGADIPLDLVGRVLARVGCVTKLEKRKNLESLMYPVCVSLKNDQFVVITAQEGSEFVLADVDVRGGERRITKKELSEQFNEYSITALPELEDIQRRHVGDNHVRHWFWGQFRLQKKLLFDVALGSLVANILAVAVSLFALQVYDRVIPNHSTTSLWVLVVGCLIAILLEAVLRVSRSFLMDTSGKAIELNLSVYLFEKLNGMQLSKRPASPGSLVHMMREFGSVREFFTNTSIGSAADIPFVLVFLSLIYAIAGNVVWLVVIGMILIVVPSILFQSKMQRLAAEMLGGSSAAAKLLTEVAYGQESVKAIRGESYFQRKWEEIIALNAAKTTDQRVLAAKLTYWSAAVQQSTYIATVVTGVFLVFSGDFTVGTIIALSILCTRALSPVTQLSGTLARWQQVKSALIGLDEIAHSKQERSPGQQFARRDVLSGDITLKNIQFSYIDDTAPNLDISQFRIKDGSTVAILGENGSGKSTLLKALSGLYSAQRGTISIDGIELRQVDPTDVRKNIGYLPQDVKLFTGTLRDNLLMGSLTHDEAGLLRALEFSGLSRLLSTSPKGLDMEIVDGGEGMSVGQRQSVGLARLFLQDPRIVLLDEPTASLDQTLEAHLVKELKSWLDGRTCVFATHRMPILSVADRVVVMRQGNVELDGAAGDVIKKLTAKPAPDSSVAV